MSSFGKQVATLIAKEWQQEFRNSYAVAGVVLYLLQITFVCYAAFQLKQTGLSPAGWNAIAWVIVLFVSITAVGKSFLLERAGYWLYIYQLASAEAVITAKLLYNGLINAALAGTAGLAYSFVMGYPGEDFGAYLGLMAFGGLSIGATLTLLSAIASKTQSGGLLMPVLSLPLIIPMLLLLIKAGKDLIDGLGLEALDNETLPLLGLLLSAVGLSLVLFKYIWRS